MDQQNDDDETHLAPEEQAFARISHRVAKQLCLECGTADNVNRGLCGNCRQLPRYQELLSMEITFAAKYYLAVGHDTHAEKLCDCRSEHIELAEAEAEEALQSIRAAGNLKSMVRVVEAESRLIVYTTGRTKREE